MSAKGVVVVKQKCYLCNRFITITKNGHGVFRRHTVCRGLVCDGTALKPADTKEKAAKETQARIQDLERANNCLKADRAGILPPEENQHPEAGSSLEVWSDQSRPAA